jgi:hypothetical protein
MAVIPGGCTSLIQAPDVCWNKPFKAHYRELYEEWMSSDASNHTFTKGGNQRPPTRVLLATWVKCAWDKIPPELIRKSFLVCGISNSLDGTEDNLINVLKPGSVVGEHRDLNLKALHECRFNAEHVTEPDDEEDPLHVSIDDDDDVPLAKLCF